MKIRKIIGSIILAFVFLTLEISPLFAAEHKEVHVTIFSGKVATTNWAIFQGMADIINKNHPWLRASVTSLASAVESFRTAAQRENLRSHSFFFGDESTQSAFAQGLANLPKFEGLMAVLKVYSGWDSWVTLDPKIKTIYDLAGKSVDMGIRGTTVNLLQTKPLLEAAGVYEKVKPLNLGWSKGKDGLVNGNIDAYWTYAGESAPPRWAGQSLLVELMKTRDIHFIDIPKKVTEKVLNDEKINLPHINLPKGSLGEGQPPEDVGGIAYDICLWATKEMDPEIVYEFVKTIADHIGELGSYHAAGKAANLHKMPDFAVAKSQFHPGAIKFYREKKLLD
jgi:TRAP transporter TAXI family solute receptor